MQRKTAIATVINRTLTSNSSMGLFFKQLGFLILWIFLIEKTNLLDVKFQQDDYQMKFERAELVRYNKDFLKSYQVTTFKYNRTTPLVNCTHEYKITPGNDIEIIIQAYVFLSNEYRDFPIRFEVNWCEVVGKNYIGMSTGMRKSGKCGNHSGCPQVKDVIYHVCNWAPDPLHFPPFLPDGKYMVELQGLYHDVEAWVIRGYGTVDRPIAIPMMGKL